MNIQTNDAAQLSMDELETVNGGVVPFLVGFAVGYLAGAAVRGQLAL